MQTTNNKTNTPIWSVLAGLIEETELNSLKTKIQRLENNIADIISAANSLTTATSSLMQNAPQIKANHSEINTLLEQINRDTAACNEVLNNIELAKTNVKEYMASIQLGINAITPNYKKLIPLRKEQKANPLYAIPSTQFLTDKMNELTIMIQNAKKEIEGIKPPMNYENNSLVCSYYNDLRAKCTAKRQETADILVKLSAYIDTCNAVRSNDNQLELAIQSTEQSVKALFANVKLLNKGSPQSTTPAANASTNLFNTKRESASSHTPEKPKQK